MSDRRPFILLSLAGAAAVAVAAGCATNPGGGGPLAPRRPEPPPSAAGTPTPDAASLQAAVVVLGDEIIDLVAVAADSIEAGTTDIDRRRRAAEIKLAVGRSVVNTVAGPSAFAALIDLVVKTELLTRAAETAAPAAFGGDGDRLRESLERARLQAWGTANRAMPQTEVDRLREVLADWTLEEDDLVFVAQTSVKEFTAGIGSGESADGRRRVTLLSLLALDPLAGLDPTTREIERTRLLGERAFYQAQRTGRLLRWEVESLLYSVLAAPETQGLLRAADRASRAVDGAAGTLASLPETLAAERTAAIAELEAVVDRQRTALLAETEAAVARQRTAAVDELQAAVAAEREALRADVAAVEGPLVRTMDAARGTITEATALSASLQDTLAAFDAVLEQMGVDGEAAAARPARADDEPPFDVRAYGEAAGEIGAAADRLTATLEAFRGVLAEPLLRPEDAAGAGAGAGAAAPAGATSREVPAAVALRETGTALLDAMLIRGAILIGLAGVTAVGVVVIARRLGRRG
ncbi:MAG: hypothetical protein ACYTEV_12210 [Planctomycetota bacterium]